MLPHLRFAALACLTLLLPAFARAKPPQRPNEIVVSAVNYVQTPASELKKLFRNPADLLDLPPPPPGMPPVRHYQFLPGEKLETDLDYTSVCKLLVPALAAKGLVNTFDQSKVDLILRVTFGRRPWRDPLVRNDYLEWRHGLVPRRLNRSASLSASTSWDNRAGGDDSSIHRAEWELTELNPTSGAEGMADRLIGGLHTEDFFLIVVDAFELATLRTKGNSTPRIWTTFIAVPCQGRTKFSDVAADMIAKAAPYFGETLPGRARFTDREGKVTPGELRVVDEDVPAPKR